MKIYVGNLSFDATEDGFRELFKGYGEVESADIVMDRDSGQPRGFGFVEMQNQNEAERAIQELNGKEFMGQELNVNEARPREDRGRGGGRGRGDNRW
ncbi:MAG: RNA recognition motif domain-containing protein [Candidatus Poribacteria bacterium]